MEVGGGAGKGMVGQQLPVRVREGVAGAEARRQEGAGHAERAHQPPGMRPCAARGTRRSHAEARARRAAKDNTRKWPAAPSSISR